MYQIIDDYLDYFGNNESLGKNIADDFKEGKITLPLILLHKFMPQDERLKLESMLESSSRNEGDFGYVMNQLEKYNIKQELFKYIQKYYNQAKQVLDTNLVIDSGSKEKLLELIEFTFNRQC
jgi:octaprenyl-diphosphate synthase